MRTPSRAPGYQSGCRNNFLDTDKRAGYRFSVVDTAGQPTDDDDGSGPDSKPCKGGHNEKSIAAWSGGIADGTGGVGGRRDAQKGRKPHHLCRGRTAGARPDSERLGGHRPRGLRQHFRRPGQGRPEPANTSRAWPLKWDISDRRQGLHLPAAQRRQFHNGEPFNAAVAKWNLERGAAEGTKNAHPEFFRIIEKIETPDESTLKLTLKNSGLPIHRPHGRGGCGHAADEGLREHRGPADRHRAVQVRGLEPRGPGGDGPQREVLESASCPISTR